ncbi:MULTISPECIES: hypothetical protein [unclassified Wolbachia]|uniref:hypothetical protein n=1 Tax=unclassified Wolbachia TaxID=2640676 RepID=UPI0012E7A6D9|nr:MULTISPECIES: hypothetical protein [unclassified Wolbachia]
MARYHIVNDVIPVPRLFGSRKLNSTPSKCTIRTRFQTGMTPYLTVIPRFIRGIS